MIAIIGGSGFIGSRLALILEEKGVDFIIVDKVKSNIFHSKTILADVRDRESLLSALEGVNEIVNLAAEHRDDVTPKSLYDDVNVFGAENICSVALELGIKKIIFTSSVAVYGFAPKGTDESGEINFFNDYGRTKWEAEKIYRKWDKTHEVNSLVIIRPTVVFGEDNRGNVYNLLKQIASGRFLMIGHGNNVKSMAYVGNVASFIHYCLSFDEGYFLFNYIDKPDYSMNYLVEHVYKILNKPHKVKFRIPYWLGYVGGLCFDILAKVIGKKLSISSIRIKKFCSDSSFSSEKMLNSSFKPPFSIEEGIEKTIIHEFIESN